MDENKIVHSATVSNELQQLFAGMDLKGQKLLWNDTESMPALIELYSPGNQKVYLYIGEPHHGEFPIARYDPEPCVWITEPSLIQYILSCSKTDGLSEDEDIKAFLTKDTSTDLEEVKEKNKESTDKEWWHENFEFPQ